MCTEGSLLVIIQSISKNIRHSTVCDNDIEVIRIIMAKRDYMKTLFDESGYKNEEALVSVVQAFFVCTFNPVQG